MASDLDNAMARRTAIYAELSAMSHSTPGGRPDIAGGGMGTVQHVEYRMSLYRELESINKMIDSLQGPWETPLEGRPA